MTRRPLSIAFPSPSRSEIVKAYADLEQHWHRTHKDGVCASCGKQGERGNPRRETTPSGFTEYMGSLAPARYYLCEVCS